VVGLWVVLCVMAAGARLVLVLVLVYGHIVLGNPKEKNIHAYHRSRVAVVQLDFFSCRFCGYVDWLSSTANATPSWKERQTESCHWHRCVYAYMHICIYINRYIYCIEICLYIYIYIYSR